MLLLVNLMVPSKLGQLPSKRCYQP